MAINQKINSSLKLVSKNCFEIFGSTHCFENEINWQQDFKTTKTAVTWRNKLLFYSEIKPSLDTLASQASGIRRETKNIFSYQPDIKVPWELSRFQHLYTLGKEYKKTKDEKYAQIFKNQVLDWINKNPFLLGVNWVCAMEVAIRSINFIHAFNFFKNSKVINQNFWQKFKNSLHEHMIYLENNWEESDRPNNHYLSDLIGYFYLTLFFKDLKKYKRKQKWVVKKLLKQFNHQIQDDGTNYEGSTSYHKLVTEIFWHFKILCEQNKINLPVSFDKKLNKMFKFIQDCSDLNGNFVQIGDNDSGRITLGRFCHEKVTNKTCTNYPNFGLTIINNKKWHITFRHPTYNKKQPTGHFHQDELSITLSVNEIPILVDPGTYLYTANTFARNYFRSYENHNTFYIPQKEQLKDIFQLPKAPQANTSKIELNKNKITISNHANNLQRKIIFDSEKKVLEVYDNMYIEGACPELVEGTCPEPRASRGVEGWNFIFHPNLTLEKKQNNWIIKKSKKEIMIMSSNISFEKVQGFYSAGYGKIEKCVKLTGKNKNLGNKTLKSVFVKIK